MALGVFNCTYGEYASIPRCKNPSDSFIRIPYVKGTLRARLHVVPVPTPAPAVLPPVDENKNETTETTTTQAPLVVPTDNPVGPGLRSRVQAGIAAGCDRSETHVELVNLSIDGNAVSRRLLAPFFARQLQGNYSLGDYSLETVYKVEMQSDAAAQALLVEIRQRPALFTAKLIKVLVQADPRLDLRNVLFMQPYIVYSYILREHEKDEPQTKESNLLFYVGVIGGSLCGVCCICSIGLGYVMRKPHHIEHQTI